MGPPNAGKDVQAERLAARLGAVHLSSGELLRKEKDPRLMALMATGALVPSADFERILSQAIAAVPAEQPIVLAGIAKKPGEAEWLLEQLPKLGRKLSKVVMITIDKEVSHERSRQRGRFDDHPEVQDERWARFFEETMRSVEIFRKLGLVVEVDGSGTEDEVTELIGRALE
jgi:adenylate kinase